MGNEHKMQLHAHIHIFFANIPRERIHSILKVPEVSAVIEVTQKTAGRWKARMRCVISVNSFR